MPLSDFVNKQIDEIGSQEYSSLDWIKDPPTFDEHLVNGYDEPIILSKKQHDSVLAVIGSDPKKIFSPERVISLGVFCVGKGGGKDFLIAITMDYMITVLMHMRSPQRFLGMEGNLDLLNVAIKGKQGERIFFSEFVSRVKKNNYYKSRYVIYEKGKKINTPLKVEGIININTDNAEFPYRVRCFSESSKNETWEGYNVIFYVLDEISGFVSETQRENGWKIYETAKTSCSSRVTDKFKGLGFVISYPRKEKNDIIFELFKMSRQFDFMYGVFAFSWHFKPKHKYCGKTFKFHSKRFNRFFKPKMKCPKCSVEMNYTGDEYFCDDCHIKIPDDEPVMGIEIPIELENEFKENPEGALTKFCCLPPRTFGEYFEYPEKVWACIDYQQKPMFNTEYYTVTKEVEGEIFTYRAVRIVSINERDTDIRKNMHYVAWLDNAEVACDAVIAIARKETITVKNETGATYQKEICRIVDIIPWIPLPNLPVDLENVEDFLTKILPRYINLKEVGADRWESALLDRKLKNVGIRAHRHNLLNVEYDTAKYHIYLGAMKIFDEEPYVNKDLKEYTSLEQMLSLMAGDTKPVKDAKERVKKDKSDAVVGCINLTLGNVWTSEKKRPNVQKANVIGKPKNISSAYMPTTFNPRTTIQDAPIPSKQLPMPKAVRV